MKAYWRILHSIALCCLLFKGNVYAQGEVDFTEANQAASADTEKFFGYFTDWVMLSHIHRSGENAATVDNLFNTFLKDYASSPILQDVLSTFNNGQMSVAADAFFKQTGIRLYFVGYLDLKNSDPRFEPVLSLLNKSLTAKIKDPTTPYLIVTNTLSGDKNAGFTIATSVRYSNEIKAGKYNLDKTDRSNPFLAALVSKADSRNTAGEQILNAMMAGVATLQENVTENYLPNLLIAYRDKLYKSGESIEAAVQKDGRLTLEALDKEQNAPSRTVEWLVSPEHEKMVKEGNQLTIPTDEGGDYAIQAKVGSDEVNITLKVQGLGQDLKDLIKKLLMEALAPRQQQAQLSLDSLETDSVQVSAEVARNIRNIEASNYPLEGQGEELSVLQEPTVLSAEEEQIFNQSNDRKEALESLRKKKRIKERLYKTYQLVSYIDKVLGENNKELGDLADALVANSGQLLAQFVITGLSKEDSTAMKDIVATFLDDNLGELAGTGLDESAFATFLEPIDPPVAIPSSYEPGKNYYISPMVPLEDREEFAMKIEAYQASQDNPPFVVVNYSQDISTESYLARAPKGRPKGIPEGQEYVVVTVVNSPGSVEVSYLTDHPDEVTVDENGGLVFGKGGASEEDEDIFANLFNDIANNAEEVVGDWANPDCTYLVDPHGNVFGLPNSLGTKLTIYYLASVPQGTTAQFEIGGVRYQFFEGNNNSPAGYYVKVNNKFEIRYFNDCETSQEEIFVKAPYKDQTCNQLQLRSGTFTVGADVSKGVSLANESIIFRKGLPTNIRGLGEEDLLREGKIVGDFTDSGNGVMFALPVGENNETVFFFRQIDGKDFTEIYYVWTPNCGGWIETDLITESVLKDYPEVYDLMGLWIAIKNDPVHSTLAAAGFIPILGVAFDGLDALVYVSEERFAEAALSAAAIISSGVVVGVKSVVKVTSQSIKKVELLDEFAEGMETALKNAEEAGALNAEQLMVYQRSLGELAVDLGDDGMRKLLSLSEGMNNVKFLEVADELAGLENAADFFADLEKTDFLDYIKSSGKDGVEAWRALDNIGVDDVIRKNPDYLKNMDDYAKRSGKTPDEVADLAKNNENGVEQFLDELEDTPASGHWDKNPFKRGQDIEDQLGQNLPETFKTIDKFDFGTGDAISIKSLDLDAKTYQTPSKLKSRLNKYLDELDGFSGYQQEGFRVGNVSGGTSITSKSLELALPRAATGEQLNVINQIIADAASRVSPTNPSGIGVIIRIIP